MARAEVQPLIADGFKQKISYIIANALHDMVGHRLVSAFLVGYNATKNGVMTLFLSFAG